MKTLNTLYPGYETQYLSYLHDDCQEVQEAKERQLKVLNGFECPEGMKIEERYIPGYEEGQKVRVRIFTPADVMKPSPMILEIHGGNWYGGSIDIDNFRCIELAKRVPAIVVCVDYRLAGNGICYPQPLMDCYAAYMWMAEHGKEIGGDGSRIGMHGTSAGGNLAAGLAMYLRDHDKPKCSLAVLNCALMHQDYSESHSFFQYYHLRMCSDNFTQDGESMYLGRHLPEFSPKYAFPGHAESLKGLCPHYIITAEYDTFRDSGLRYALRLLQAGVHCDIQSAGYMCHGFSCVGGGYTDWTHDGIALAFRREFGML